MASVDVVEHKDEAMTHRLLALPLAALAIAAAPAAAQDDEERVNMVIVYGNDECPPSTEAEITVCARKDESERYRIPAPLRFSDDPANIAWAERVQRYETVGAFGALSCSPAGAGGFTGCTQALIDAAYGEKREGGDVRFGQLIAEARAKRLSTIDESAAEEQARVEAIEQEYMDRLEKEREQALPGEAAPAEGASPGDSPPIMDDGRAPPPPDE
jgi:hypothetical protein